MTDRKSLKAYKENGNFMQFAEALTKAENKIKSMAVEIARKDEIELSNEIGLSIVVVLSLFFLIAISLSQIERLATKCGLDFDSLWRLIIN